MCAAASKILQRKNATTYYASPQVFLLCDNNIKISCLHLHIEIAGYLRALISWQEMQLPLIHLPFGSVPLECISSDQRHGMPQPEAD
jgi:hypothetical protein